MPRNRTVVFIEMTGEHVSGLAPQLRGTNAFWGTLAPGTEGTGPPGLLKKLVSKINIPDTHLLSGQTCT